MHRGSCGLAVVLVLAFGFLGCQDQGAVAPDDLTPLFAVDCTARPDHPQCTDPDPDPPPEPSGTSVLFTDGFNPGEPGQPWDWMEWDPGKNPKLLLELYSENPFETDLGATYNSMDWTGEPAGGEYGPCSYEPADATASVIVALAEQLDGIVVLADTPEEEHIRMTRINVEKEGTSLENFVRFLYISDHPDLRSWDKRKKDWVNGDVGFQVGGQFNAKGDTQVTIQAEGDTQIFTYSGGTVSVAHRAGDEIRLQCPLMDVVVVNVK